MDLCGRLYSCPVVIVDDTAKHLSLLHSATSDPLPTWEWHTLTYPLVWTSRVVMFFDILSQYITQMCFVQNQDVIEAFFSDGAYPSLCKRVGIGCLVRVPMTRMSSERNTASNLSVNLVHCHEAGNEIHSSCLPSSKPIAWPAASSTLHSDSI